MKYQITEQMTKRFWSKVSIGTDDQCWLWQGNTNGKYGTFWPVKGTGVGAHRFIWTSIHGELSSDVHVCHKCDNPLCVNPSHLFAGQAQDNMTDKVKKDRQHKGEQIKNSTLKEEDITNIFAMYNSGIPIEDIYARFNISRAETFLILQKKRWKHVSQDIPVKRRKPNVFSLEKANEVRTLYATGEYTYRQLAAQFNTTDGTIGKIVNHQLWRER